VRYLPAHNKPISTYDELGDNNHGTYGSQLVQVKLMAASRFAMAIGLYPFFSFLCLFCSLVLSKPPRMLVPLRPWHFLGSSGDNRIAMSHWNSKVPIEWHIGHGAL
jgi:hypothetical protein